MGQKITPTSLRIQNSYTVLGPKHEYAYNLTFFKLIRFYFLKKGFIVNNLNIYKNNNIVVLTLDFFISRNSKLYTKKYRKFLKKSKSAKSFSKPTTQLSQFLKVIAQAYDVPKVYFKAKRLDLHVRKKTLLALINAANKVGLFRYKKNKTIKDLIFALSLLLDKEGINSSVFNLLISKHFSWLPKRQHKRFLAFLRELFQVVFTLDKKNKDLLHGIKLLVSGRIAGKTQASKFQFIIGRIFTQSIDANIDFNKNISYSKLGVYGWKLWITKK